MDYIYIEYSFTFYIYSYPFMSRHFQVESYLVKLIKIYQIFPIIDSIVNPYKPFYKSIKTSLIPYIVPI